MIAKAKRDQVDPPDRFRFAAKQNLTAFCLNQNKNKML